MKTNLRISRWYLALLVCGGAVSHPSEAAAQQRAAAPGAGSLYPAPAVAQERVVAPGAAVPDLAALISQPSSELRDVVTRFSTDRTALSRRYRMDYAPEHQARFRQFYSAWQNRLHALDFNRLGQEGRIDYLLLDNRLRYELELVKREERNYAELAKITPFVPQIIQLQEARARMDSMNAAQAGSTLARLALEIRQARAGIGALKAETKPTTAYRAATLLQDQQRTLKQWYDYYAGYDPLFTWWAAAPYKEADAALTDYIKSVREELVGIRPGQEEPIIGDPIGADGMRADLAVEMIPYTPEELIAIAEREFAWCEAEMRKAAREMGYGDDWKAALEKVKTMHVAPGAQPDLVRDLAAEAVAFLKEHDLIDIPPLADEIWRAEMMTPARQRVNPFFTGGEVISISFPTDEMSQADKLMSMRGNNIPFSRATVHHELIPGHHLQGFMNTRYNEHRRLFSTPFATEGWSLYWEMLLWDQGFAKTPEDRMGMLFWRTHRAARIIFSLRFHLGTMTPQEAIDFLVDRVGHERANATAEVRRSFLGNYSPLYQVAYMMGGLQYRALHAELVDSGKMTNRQFHDAILKGGPMPVELVRARLMGQPLTRDYTPRWKFAGEQ
jgi:uncharacterized protein (DUF885 family)